MRRRIVVLAAATALLAVMVLSIPLGVIAGRGYVRGERLELQRAAASAAARARGDVSSTAFRIADTEIELTVYDKTGRRVSGPGPAAPPPTVLAALSGRAADSSTSQILSVAAPVSDGDRVVAALLLSTSLDAVHHRTLIAWLLLAAMDIAAALVAVGAAVVLARRLAGPVDRLTAVAEQVGRGDLTARAPSSGIYEFDTLASTLNTTVERVRSMLERERAFSAEVSHQLRTPLSRLRLHLEAAESAGGAEHVRRAIADVDLLETTIVDVITLARDLTVEQRVVVDDLVAAVTERWHGPLAAAGRPLRVSVDGATPHELGISRPAAMQILEVLLDNASKHGRGTVSIKVRGAGEDLAVVEVSDEGAPLRADAWELFGRRDDRTDHGLGLPYARRLAEAEGARLMLARAQPPTFALTVRVVASSDDGQSGVASGQ